MKHLSYRRLGLALIWLSSTALPTFAAPPRSVRPYKFPDGRTSDVLSNQVLIGYKTGRAPWARRSLAQALNVTPKKELSSLNIDLVAVPAGETLESFIAKVQTNPDVEWAEPNGILRASETPNDPKFPVQYSLQNFAGGGIDPSDAWDTVDSSTITTPVIVAVIDTGTTLNHPDLAANLWTNPSPSTLNDLHGKTIEIQWNSNGNCTDTATQDPDLAVTGPEQCESGTPTDNNNTSFDVFSFSCQNADVYHGTRTSGIIAAVANNATSITGVGRHTQVMAIKALNQCGQGTFGAIAEAIDYATQHGASIINMSLGGSSGSDAVSKAIQRALAQDIVIVAAAGNAGNGAPVEFPASIPQVIAVGATDSSRHLASFSCTGANLDLVAPGVSIQGLVPITVDATGANTADGTSFSSPIVAGVAALIRAVAPTATYADVTRYLDFTANDLGGAGYDSQFGFGLVSAKNAVAAAKSGTIFNTNPANPGETFPYPNPFHPSTDQNVAISLPTSLLENGAAPGLEIMIINSAGERVKTLRMPLWDGKNDDGTFVASGFYFYRAKTSKGNAKGKITVIR